MVSLVIDILTMGDLGMKFTQPPLDPIAHSSLAYTLHTGLYLDAHHQKTFKTRLVVEIQGQAQEFVNWTLLLFMVLGLVLLTRDDSGLQTGPHRLL